MKLKVNKLQFTILLFPLLVACSVNRKIDKSPKERLGYNDSSHCPAYSFSQNGSKLAKWYKHRDNHISMADKGYLASLRKARDYIKNRAGQKFSDQTKLYNFYIAYPDSIDKFNRNSWYNYDLEKCGDVKYWFRFIYTDQRNIYYMFRIAMNDKNEIVSSHRIPDVNKSPDFSNIITPNEAYKLAKKYCDSLVRPLNLIRLAYNNDINCFVWSLERKVDWRKSSDYHGQINVNARNGKILSYEKHTITITHVPPLLRF